MIVDKIDSVPALIGLETEWRQIEGGSGLPFASWDWAVAWWTQFRENKFGVKDSLCVLAIRTDTRALVAVAPMLLSRRPSLGPLCLRQLQFFGADPNITELRGMLALPEWRTQAYRALLAYARDNAEQWDSMLLSGVPQDLQLSELSQFARSAWSGETTSYELPLPASWEELRAGLGRNIKESLRKCYNSLKRDGRAFRLNVVERPSDVAAALEQFYALHRARADLRGTVQHNDVFDTPESRRFLLDVCARFARRGSLRIFQLLIDERVAAVRIGFIVGDTLYLYYSGFDDEFSRYSVMTTTVAEAIKYAISLGLKKVNLSTGRDISKTRWDPIEVSVRHALLISPSRRAQVALQVYGQTLNAIANNPALRRATRFLARRSAAIAASQRQRAPASSNAAE